MNLKDFLQLAGKQGKVVIVDEAGEVKGVFLPYDEYQKIVGEKSAKPEPTAEDVAEKVNREILQAQLEEVISSSDGGTSQSNLQNVTIENDLVDEPVDVSFTAERIDSLINKRAQDLFKSIPYNFTAAPEVSSAASDEEIKPNFDDI